MTDVARARLKEVVLLFREGVYEASFRGKSRGRFAITREQLRTALKVERLHTSTIQALQDCGLSKGIVIIDLDDLFICVETNVVRGYRRPPAELFTRLCNQYVTAIENVATTINAEGDEDDNDAGI